MPMPLITTSASSVAAALPPIIADVPLNSSALVVYVMVGVSVFMVLYLGFKKPKGPGAKNPQQKP